MYGKILNKNTIEQFKECDKTHLINSEGRAFWDSVKNGAALKNPSVLSFFYILSYAVSVGAVLLKSL